MKATKRLIDNIANEDYRKCKIELAHATDHLMKTRIADKKKEIISKINSDKKDSKK